MPIDAGEIRVGTTGNLYVAPVGTAAPPDPPAAWPVAWVDLGALSEDGAAMTPSMAVNEIKIWQSAYTVRRVVTDRGMEWKVTVMQRNAATFMLAMGGGLIEETTTGSGVFRFTPPPPSTIDERAFGLEVRENLIVDRYYLRRGIVSATGDVMFRRGEATRFDLTISALGDDTNVTWELVTNDAGMAPA